MLAAALEQIEEVVVAARALADGDARKEALLLPLASEFVGQVASTIGRLF